MSLAAVVMCRLVSDVLSGDSVTDFINVDDSLRDWVEVGVERQTNSARFSFWDEVQVNSVVLVAVEVKVEIRVAVTIIGLAVKVDVLS